MISEVESYWSNGSNCAQSTAAGLLDHFHLLDTAQTFHLALIPFGGGFKEGEVCGAVSGSLAALSFLLSQFGASEPEIQDVCASFRAKIHETYQSIKCYGITGEFRNKAHEILPAFSDARRTRCDEAVGYATDLVLELVAPFQKR
jgi:C_GCAxxG_C_C family probable redox protein